MCCPAAEDTRKKGIAVEGVAGANLLRRWSYLLGNILGVRAPRVACYARLKELGLTARYTDIAMSAEIIASKYAAFS